MDLNSIFSSLVPPIPESCLCESHGHVFWACLSFRCVCDLESFAFIYVGTCLIKNLCGGLVLTSVSVNWDHAKNL